MIRLRKKTAIALAVVLVLGLLAVTPVFAAEQPNGRVNPVEVCTFDGQVEIKVTNIWSLGGYFGVCTNEAVCAELGYLGLEESAQVTLPYGIGCVGVWECDSEYIECAYRGQTCDQETPWPACPAACEGGAGLYPPSNSGVPYNGYNESGYFILVVDNHCDQYVDSVGIYIGDPLAEITQVMSLPVDPNGWTQFSEDDIMGIRDMYTYEGEIWFKVPIIGDRYYGLHELMTHPNLGSGD